MAALQRLEAEAKAAPQDAGKRLEYGLLLADPFADERAIAELDAALQLGVTGEDAVRARFWIGWLAVWNGRDREAMAAFQEVQRAPIPSDIDDEARSRAQWRRQAAAGQVEAIQKSHAALAGVGAAEGRAVALLVILCLGIIGMFWGGRRLARTRFAPPQSHA